MLWSGNHIEQSCWSSDMYLISESCAWCAISICNSWTLHCSLTWHIINSLAFLSPCDCIDYTVEHSVCQYNYRSHSFGYYAKYTQRHFKAYTFWYRSIACVTYDWHEPILHYLVIKKKVDLYWDRKHSSSTCSRKEWNQFPCNICPVVPNSSFTQLRHWPIIIVNNKFNNNNDYRFICAHAVFRWLLFSGSTLLWRQ